MNVAPVKLTLSILLFVTVISVLGYQFYQPIRREQADRNAVFALARQTIRESPDTHPDAHETGVLSFNMLGDRAEIGMYFRHNTTGEERYFRYTFFRHDGQWRMDKREVIPPQSRGT